MATKKRKPKVVLPKPCPAGCYKGYQECGSCGGTACACDDDKGCGGGCGSCTECTRGDVTCETCGGTGEDPEE